jgi:tRNA(fMet)-specific endonuclease VapC
VLEKLQKLQPDELAISVITFAELMNGAKKSQKVKDNIRKLEELAEILIIEPFDKKAAIAYGNVRSSLEKRGMTIGSNDMLIAAHALSRDWTLVTNNEKEFRRVKGLKVENWVKK